MHKKYSGEFRAMGVPKKPHALRVAHGTENRNKHRDNQHQPMPTKGVGPAPEHFDILQSEIWDEIVSVSHPGVLCEPDRVALEIAATLLHRYRWGGRVEEVHPLTGTELGQLTGMLSRFGMTPADRTKIVAPKSGEANPYAGY